jgi:hypothetical protein
MQCKSKLFILYVELIVCVVIRQRVRKCFVWDQRKWYISIVFLAVQTFLLMVPLNYEYFRNWYGR